MTPPFWTVLSERRPFVSKGCTTRMDCENQKEFFRNRCFVSSLRDWTCADCCYTDNCNYLVENLSSRFPGRCQILSLLLLVFFVLCK
ncbi:hypothetical protein TcWFU_008414 [Taenia crassiceps]|uniref:Uncharacterized protein n=1 Tax=Taenia crassiceps TaxID=6207 RepID=A0ABR4Q906_9CEST